jgi:hypothetical protein
VAYLSHTADLVVELSSIIAVSLTNQTAMLESAWSLRQCGQEISPSVLANFRKVALSTSTPVETSCPVLGHTNISVPIAGLLIPISIKRRCINARVALSKFLRTFEIKTVDMQRSRAVLAIA